MNDPKIREALHNVFLEEQHREPSTLILDELGLMHGKCRADVAVINGRMEGYEIKSDVDSLLRLKGQIESYDAIFDRSYAVVTPRHLSGVEKSLPNWWGIVAVSESNSGFVTFRTLRIPSQNPNIDDYAVAQLLWREEAQEILSTLGVRGNQLRQKRSLLYSQIVNRLDSDKLHFLVREYLKKRKTWRLHG
jgi:hypothetical protein